MKPESRLAASLGGTAATGPEWPLQGTYRAGVPRARDIPGLAGRSKLQARLAIATLLLIAESSRELALDDRTLSTIRIERRFRGPPNSGNGGYSAGRLAAFIDGSAAVTLHMPPPL